MVGGAISMGLSRSVNRRGVIVGAGVILQALGFLLSALFLSTTPVTFASVVLFGFGGGMAQYPCFREWSQELFPAMVKAKGQGLVYGVVSILISFYSFLLTVPAAAGVQGIACLLLSFLVVSGLMSTIRTLGTASVSLEEI